MIIIHHHHSSIPINSARVEVSLPRRPRAYARGCKGRGVVVRWTRLRCTRLQHRTCKTSRGTSLRSWSLSLIIRCIRLRCPRLQHRMCKTSQVHFTSDGLGTDGFSTERARLAGGTSLRSWFKKKVPATWRDFFFFKKSPNLKIKVGFIFT